MLKDFELASQRHEEIKQASALGAMARPFVAAAKWMGKRPMTTLAGVGVGADLALGAKDLSKGVTDYAAPIIKNTTGTF